MLNVFQGDAFGLVSLTASMELLPVNPTKLGSMKLFTSEGVTTTVVGIERRNGRLTLIPTAPRGTMPEWNGRNIRSVRNFSVPHIPKNDTVLAESIQGLREFGSDDSTVAVASMINQRLQELKNDHEVTAEYHRFGALSGVVKDADMATNIYNLFTEFGVVETSFTYVPATAGDMQTKSLNVKRTIERALGNSMYTGIHVLCSPEFFDAFTQSADVKSAYSLWRDGEFARSDNRKGFEMYGMTWEEYDPRLGANRFLAANKARAFPVGVPGLFRRFNAPGTFMEAVNTVGKEYYAKQEVLRFDQGVEIHTQSNPLHICTIPETLISLTL